MGVSHRSPCSVAIAPHDYAGRARSGITEITVGFDGSPEASTALTDALELARASGAPVKLVVVAEPPPIIYAKGGGPDYSWHALKEDLREVMRERLDKAIASLPDNVRVEGERIEGHAEAALPRWPGTAACWCSARAPTGRCDEFCWARCHAARALGAVPRDRAPTTGKDPRADR